MFRLAAHSPVDPLFLNPLLLLTWSHLTGTCIDPTFFMSRTVSNVISSIVFGDRFDYEDKEFLPLLDMIWQSFQFTATATGQVTFLGEGLPTL
jgi:hypothetical protein